MEIETPSGVKTLKLGHNNAENPFNAAQRFIDQNQLHQSYLGDIVEWITSRSGQSMPTIGQDASQQQSSNLPTTTYTPAHTPAVTAKKQFSFETKAFVYYDDIPASNKLLGKLIEFNELVESEVKLSQTDIEDLESVMKVIGETSRYHVSIISEAQVRCLMRPVLGWTAEYCFPLFDILRIICIHPVGAEAISKLRDVGRVVERALSFLSSELSHSSSSSSHTPVPAPYPTCLTASRFLCNAMRSDILRSKIFSTGTLLSSYVSMLDANTSTSTTYLQLNKLIRVSISRILINFTSPKAIILLSEAQIQVLLDASQRILASEKESAEVVFNALQAIGTIIVSSSSRSLPIAATAAVSSSDMKQALQQQLTSSLQYWSSVSLNAGGGGGGGIGDSAMRCLQEVLDILSS